MRKRWFSTLVFLIGLAIFASPFVSQAYNAMHQTGIARSVDRRAENLDTRMVNTLTEKAEKRNNRNKTGVTEKSLKSLNKPAEAVSDMITIPDSQALGTISIPKIDVYLPIYDGVSEKELQKGAGLLPGSSIPLGGHGEHAVITGHSGLPNKIMFTNIGKLKKGDLFFIQVLGKEFTYEVDKKKVVTPENVEDLALHHPDNFVTLVTCTPYGVNSHRLLVRGHLTDKRPTPTVIWEQWWLMLLLASGLIAIVALLLWLIRRTIKRRKAK